MTEPAAYRPLSVEEYLRSEASSPIRREYVAGYLIVEQDTRRVGRDDQRAWRHDEVSAAAATSVVPVPCPTAAELTLEIYEGVDVPTPRERPRRIREASRATRT